MENVNNGSKEINNLNNEGINSQNGYYNRNPQYSYRVNPEEEKAKQMEAAKESRSLGVISLIYAAVFVICLYKNFSGITSPIWTAATAFYMYYVAKTFEGLWNKMNTFMSVVIILLGFSNFVTDNGDIIFMNYMAIIVLISVNMVLIFYDTKKINVTGHIALILEAVFGALGELEAPFTQVTAFAKERKQKNDKLVYVVIGVVITIPILVVITSILASADEVFNKIFQDIANLLSIDMILENIFGIMFMALVGYVGPYIYTRNVKKKNIKIKEGKTGDNEPIIAIIVTTAISVVYVLFSAIQIFYLFMGNGTLPDGYTYADYAREGFFQLLFVCAFNLLMVLVCIEFLEIIDFFQ